MFFKFRYGAKISDTWQAHHTDKHTPPTQAPTLVFNNQSDTFIVNWQYNIHTSNGIDSGNIGRSTSWNNVSYVTSVFVN